MVACPICNHLVKEVDINRHIDSDCKLYLDEPTPPPTQAHGVVKPERSGKTSDFFTPAAKRNASFRAESFTSSPAVTAVPASSLPPRANLSFKSESGGSKRSREVDDEDTKLDHNATSEAMTTPVSTVAAAAAITTAETAAPPPPLKKAKHAANTHAPLAERMRPQSLDDVAGQALVGPQGVLRRLIETERIPSMILWGGPGTGKTTIARLIASAAGPGGARFVEIHSTTSGVAECKRLFAEARHELRLTGRRTVIFCDEIHRFSRSQQDVFLAPVEAGAVVLIGATTENPSFKVTAALLSRCRTFVLAKLTDDDVLAILRRALARELPDLRTVETAPPPPPSDVADPSEAQAVAAAAATAAAAPGPSCPPPPPPPNSNHLLIEDDDALLRYLAAFADGDARTALNLLELALELTRHPHTTASAIRTALTQTLVYDRAGDQHYDSISAFHKSIRGSSADAALYYLARMLASGEDPLYIARRMVVIASEDVGLADNSLLPLAMAAYAAAEKIGMPECRINLAHCAVALARARKSVRAYRGLRAAEASLAEEPGIAGLPVPGHLRNAPTRLMKELGYGREYKYPPDYVRGRVRQEYLPEKLVGRRFLGDADLGTQVDPDLERENEGEGEEEVDEEGEEDEEADRLEGDDPENDRQSVAYDAEMTDDLLLNPDGD